MQFGVGYSDIALAVCASGLILCDYRYDVDDSACGVCYSGWIGCYPGCECCGTGWNYVIMVGMFRFRLLLFDSSLDVLIRG